MATTPVLVRVLDAALREPVREATVRLVAADRRALPVELRYDATANGYLGEVEPGPWRLVVIAGESYAPEQRPVRVGVVPHQELVLLGRPGQPAFFRGKVRVPFAHDPALLGVVVRRGLEPMEDVPEWPEGWEALPSGGDDADGRREHHGLGGRSLEDLGVYVLRRTGPDAPSPAEIARELRGRSGVRFVGPVLIWEVDRVALLGSRLAVRFAPEIRKEAVLDLSGRLGLTLERNLPLIPNAFVFRAPSAGVDLEVLGVCEALNALEEVFWAEPLLVQSLVDHAVNPPDFLYAFQWTHGLVGLPDAWQALRDRNPSGVLPGAPGDLTYGSPDIVVAILDRNGVQSDTAGVAVHPDLAGNTNDGRTKAVQFYDFVTMQPHNGASGLSGHGASCAGVAVGRAENLVDGVAFGVVGAAPGCRFLGVRVPQVLGGSSAEDAERVEEKLAAILAWTAGLDPGEASFPPLPTTPADIITMSFDPPADPPGQLMMETLDAIATFGRGGRGAVVVWSAGNDQEPLFSATSSGGHPAVITVSASSLGTTDTEEVATSYTNFGEVVSVCAPSANDTTSAGRVVKSYQLYSADRFITTNPLDTTATAPGVPTRSSALAAPAGAVLSLSPTLSLDSGDGVLVGNANTGDLESGKVSFLFTDDSGNFLIDPALTRTHNAGDPLYAGPPTCTANFGGTSAAAPLVAGIAALALTARPELTAVAVRDLLQRTAVKIDPTHSGWSPGLTFNPYYGHGRVNALAAVLGAADALPDLVVRDNLGDTGGVPSPGWHAASPDLWVRNADEDPPTNLAYDQDPPHQDPIRGQDNTVFVRVKNRGAVASLSARARVLITHFPGVEFTYPEDWIAAPPAGGGPLTPASYLIGEVDLPALAAGAATIAKVPWPASLVPPAQVVVDGLTVAWHPCLLVEISPQDGPIAASGGLVVQLSNNLAQRNLSVVGGGGSALGLAMGSRHSALEEIIVERHGLPPSARVVLLPLEPDLVDGWLALVRGALTPPPSGPPSGCLTGLFRPRTWLDALRAPRARLRASVLASAGEPVLERGQFAGREALVWVSGDRLVLPTPLARGRHALLALTLTGAGQGELRISQRRADGVVTGGCTVRGS